MEPGVDALAAELLNIGEAGRTIFEHDPFDHGYHMFPTHLAHDPHSIFTLDLGRRMHQAVGQLAIRGEQQQSTGIDIQTANGYPALALETRQTLEHGTPSFRILARTQLAFRLVVHDHPAWGFIGSTQRHRAIIKLYPVSHLDTITQLGHLAVNLNPASLDRRFHFPT